MYEIKKTIKILLLIVLLVITSCNEVSKQSTSYSGNEDFSNIDTVRCLSFNSKKLEQVDFFNYFNKQFFIPFTGEFNFYIDESYNMKFFGSSNNKHIIRETNIFEPDNNNEESINEYIFSNGKISSINNLKDTECYIAFKYNKNQVESIERIYRTVGVIEHIGNTANHLGNDIERKVINFKYNNNLLVSKETEHYNTNDYPFYQYKKSYCYYKDASLPNKSYLITKERFSDTERLMCFDKDKIDYVYYYKKKTVDVKSIPYKLVDFNYQTPGFVSINKYDYDKENKSFKLWIACDVKAKSNNLIDKVIKVVNGNKRYVYTYQYIYDHGQPLEYKVYEEKSFIEGKKIVQKSNGLIRVYDRL